MKHLLALALLLLTPFAVMRAADAPRGTLAPALQSFVDRRVIAGAVALVADKERVLDVTTLGVSSLDTKALVLRCGRIRHLEKRFFAGSCGFRGGRRGLW